jgi:hypothetical protein
MRKRIVLKIRYSNRSDLVTLLVLILMIPSFLAYLALMQDKVFASEEQTITTAPDRRQYYLTSSKKNGPDADESNVCAAGYHFASLWEIFDPSSLDYNTSEGLTYSDDSITPLGWVRTGYVSDSGSTAGQANCTLWSSSSGNGTAVRLSGAWATSNDFVNWDVATLACSSTNYVWCVEDGKLEYVYLPLVLR